MDDKHSLTGELAPRGASRQRPARQRFLPFRWDSDRVLAYSLIILTFLLICAVRFYPMLRAFVMSFHKWHILDRVGTWVGLKNYVSVLQNGDFQHAVGVTLIWIAGTLLLQLPLSFGAAWLLNEPLWGRDIVRGIVLFPWVISTVVTAAVFQYMFNDVFGVVNYLLIQSGLLKQPINWAASSQVALISIILLATWKYFAFFVMMFLGRLQTISPELNAAAKVDGANSWQLFRHVTLPLLMPVVLISMLLRTIWLFNKFDIVWLFTRGGPGKATTTLPIFIYSDAF